MAVDVGEGELHGLDLQVLRGHAVHRQRRQVETVEDAQGDQRRDALTVGRDLVQGVVAVALLDGRDPLRAVGGEVGGGHRATVGLRMRRRGLGDLAPVESLTAGLRDQAQRARRLGEGETLADVRRAAVGQEGLGEAGLRGDLRQRRGVGPLLLHDHRHAVAALGDLDGRRDQVGKGQAAAALVQRHPARDRPRHGDRIPSALGRGLGIGAVLAAEVVRRPGRGRAARGVQAEQLRAVPDDAEHVRTQAVAAGLDHHHRRRRGDRRVHRVAAALEHLQAGLRPQRVRRRHDIACKHG